jgi:hypothetical protein
MQLINKNFSMKKSNGFRGRANKKCNNLIKFIARNDL